jgi:hypothetical protein
MSQISGYASTAMAAEPVQNPLPIESTQVGDTGLIQSCQRPADGGDIWQTLQSQQAAHHGIILIVAHVLEPAVASRRWTISSSTTTSWPRIGLTVR